MAKRKRIDEDTGRDEPERKPRTPGGAGPSKPTDASDVPPPAACASTQELMPMPAQPDEAAVQEGLHSALSCLGHRVPKAGKPRKSKAAKAKDDTLVLQYAQDLGPESMEWRTDKLKVYRSHYDRVKAEKGAKPDMQAQRLMNEEGTAAPVVVGHVRGVKPGDRFNGRGELMALGVHKNIGGGIYMLKERPCFAIVLSGGYRDGDEGGHVWYTGQGGVDAKTKEHAYDQVLTLGNLALALSLDVQTPVRLCRGVKDDKAAAAAKAAGLKLERQYVFDGLYLVRKMRYVSAKDASKKSSEIAGCQEFACCAEFAAFAYGDNAVCVKAPPTTAAFDAYKAGKGPMVFQFKMVGVQGHSTATVAVQFGDFKGGWTKAQMARLAKRLQLAPVEAAPVLRMRRGTPHDKVLAAVRAGKLKWRHDNSAAERRALEEVRQAALAKRGVKVLVGDASKGLEPVQVPIVLDAQHADADVPLPEFEYVSDYTRATPRAADFIAKYAAEGHLQWAGARNTLGAEPGDFAKLGTVQYNRNGLLASQWHNTPLMECDDKASKLPDVSGRGVHQPLQIFYTGARGWGLRCEVALEPGTFVAVYAGRLLLNCEAEQLRQHDAYLMDMCCFMRAVPLLADLRARGAQLRARCSNDDLDNITKAEFARIPALPPADFFAWAQRQVEADPPQGPSPPQADVVVAPGELVARCLARSATPGGEATAACQSGDTSDAAPAASPLSPTPLAHVDLNASTPSKPAPAVGRADASAPPKPSAPERMAADRAAVAAQAPGGPETPAEGPSARDDEGEATPRVGEPRGSRSVSKWMSPGTELTATDDAPDAAAATTLQATWRSYKSLEDVPGVDLVEDVEHLACDARQFGNAARFINHSCQPNLVKQTIFRPSGCGALLYYQGFFAEGRIEAYQELSYDYQYETTDSKQMTCQCGAPNCRGRLR